VSDRAHRWENRLPPPRSRLSRWLPVWLALAGMGCAAPARPPAMARVAQVRASPAAAEAETWAPQAHAHALALEERAEQAFQSGDAEGADLLAEQAIAVHEHAWVLTRLARAERRRLDAEAELDEQRRALGELRAQHQRLAAEAASLELRSQVLESALPLPPHEAAAPERQQARRRAAETLSAQARLLCVGARLLGERERVVAPIRRLDELDEKLAAATGSRLLETATELRAECLAVISAVRRHNSAPTAHPSGPGRTGAAAPAPASPTNAAGTVGAASSSTVADRATAPVAVAHPSPIPADMLLDELSAAGAEPSRDERGVAVSLRELFGTDGSLTETARAEIARYAEVAGRHPDFPVLLVGHSGSAGGKGDVERQLAAVSTALAGSGVSKIEVWSVGDREPLLPARSPTARARNQRIELVFVAPGF
jgi:outer membrane protein OmpA-like peptidoglycan-associated protein